MYSHKVSVSDQYCRYQPELYPVSESEIDDIEHHWSCHCAAHHLNEFEYYQE